MNQGEARGKEWVKNRRGIRRLDQCYPGIAGVEEVGLKGVGQGIWACVECFIACSYMGFISVIKG